MKIKKFIILSLILTLSSVVCFAAAPKPNKNVYGVFSETFAGAHIDAPISDDNAVGVDFWRWTGGQQGFEAEDKSSNTSTSEGKKHWLLRATNVGILGGGGFIAKNASGNGILDMSEYKDGSIKFIVKSTYTAMSYFKVGFQTKDGTITKNYAKTLDDLGFVPDGTWQELSFDLSEYNNLLDIIQYLFRFDLEKEHYNVGDIIEIDNIRWEKKANQTAEQMTFSLLNVETNEPASSFSFTINADTDLQETTWKAANEYIKIEFNKFTLNSQTSMYDPCYLRIYTDNKSNNANPKYTGNENPMDLINESDTVARLDACWRASTYTITKNNLKIYEYYVGGNPYLSDKPNTGNCYLWMQDWDRLKNYSEDVPEELAKLEYARIWSNGLVVFTLDDKGDPVYKRGFQLNEANFSAGGFPIYLYLGADFSQAIIGGTYTTNTLTIELFYE